MDAAAPLLNLTNSGSGSDAVNKVAVAHLCSQTSFIRTTLFRQIMSVSRGIRKIGIRPVATRGIRGQSPLNFLCPYKFCCTKKSFFIKIYNKNRSLDHLKMFWPPKRLDLAAGVD